MNSPNPRPPHTPFEMALREALCWSMTPATPVAASRRRLLQVAAANQRHDVYFGLAWLQRWFQPTIELPLQLGRGGEVLLIWRLDWFTYSRQQLLR